MKRYFIGIWVLLLGLTGCSDFLEEQSNEYAYATTCKDLNELLVGSGYMKNEVISGTNALKPSNKTGVYFPWLNVMDDDAEEFVKGDYNDTDPSTMLRGFYAWEKDPCNTSGVLYNDPIWGRLYEHIAVVNVILNKAEEFTKESEADRNAVKGQCHFLRASFYYLLVNLYAKPYDPVTAERDPGVPIKLTHYVEDIEYERSTVDNVYQQIVSDLNAAIDYLKDYEPTTVRRVGLDAARTFLSRVYCYMGKWELVPELCNAVINGNKYSLKNLPGAGVKDTSWLDANSPEIIFTQGSNSINRVFPLVKGKTNSAAFRVSEELVSLFDKHGVKDGEANDCRKKFTLFREEVPANEGFSGFYIPRKVGAAPVNEKSLFVSDNFTLRLSEVYLNLAEALAMTDQEEPAREALKSLLKYRVKDLQPITATGEDLIKYIRDERRLELCFEGQRWFDLRRYAVSPKYLETKSIKHNVYGNSYGGNGTPGILEGYYLLPTYPDGGWVLPIPAVEVEQSEGSLEQNSREDCLLYN